ncbi:MAG: PASTA domain-containing protein [Bacteroidales bacterium]|nr:PASTA domain-containing protein [Bacteroidales bacterium]
MKPTVKRILINLLILVSLSILIIFAAEAWLRHYTHHNQAILVPDVTTLSLEEAARTLQDCQLRYEVVDSIHDSSQPAGAVLEQRPDAQAKVKVNRIVFLTVNAQEEKMLPVPFVKDFSQRQATATLEAVGFAIGNIVFVPSEYRNLVLDIQYQGTSIEAGTTLPVGTRLDLIVGHGRNTDQIRIPDFIGKKMDSVFLLAHSYSVNIGNIHYDETPANDKESAKYFVYQQEPTAGSFYPVGKRIDLWMTQRTDLLPTDSLNSALPGN